MIRSSRSQTARTSTPQLVCLSTYCRIRICILLQGPNTPSTVVHARKHAEKKATPAITADDEAPKVLPADLDKLKKLTKASVSNVLIQAGRPIRPHSIADHSLCSSWLLNSQTCQLPSMYWTASPARQHKRMNMYMITPC